MTTHSNLVTQRTIESVERRPDTVAQLEAIFGWHGGKMASLYTKSAEE
jgi:hypothetical protein